jgi:hypothetical protein
MNTDNLDWSLVNDAAHLLDNTPVPEPSREMDERFYAMLETEEKKQGSPEQKNHNERKRFPLLISPVWRIAAGIALFVMGWSGASLIQTAGNGGSGITELAGEVKELKESLVLTMMQQSSPVERIRAVSMVSEMNAIDGRIAESLLITLNSDRNDNVRLVALEALAHYSDMPVVREGMIKSIANQGSPMVLLRLTEIMVNLQEKRSAPEFKSKLNDVNLNYMVRTKLDETVRILI